MNVKKNDTVLVIAGKDKGKTGKVINALPKDNKVAVDGINIQKKHTKPRSANSVGGIVDQIGAIDASNVMVVCDSCKKATRVSHKIENGNKIRICKKCGASLDKAKAAETAEDKKKAKKAEKAAAETAAAVESKETKKPAAKKAKAEGENGSAEKKTKKSSKAE